VEELRGRIDKLDDELVRLLNERASHALEVGRLKQALGLESHQPAREIEVLDHARSTNGGPLDEGAITRLFERIIDEARRLERLAVKEGWKNAHRKSRYRTSLPSSSKRGSTSTARPAR
jgi:chorismate mutase